jgi:hypothetical protein
MRIDGKIIVYHSTNTKNDYPDIYHMSDTINTCLNKGKAPVSLTIYGIQCKRRGNHILTTLNR